MADKILTRRDTAATWTSVNPTLALGELGFETDTARIKFGDGSTTWTSLGYTAETGGMTDAEVRAAVEAATDSNVFTDTDHSKLDAIEASATADQTDAEIRTAVEAATDSNVFTDADHTKLNAVADNAAVSTKTVDYTLVLADAHDIVEMNKATAIVLTIPTNANEGFIIGTVISIVTIGVGICSITGDTGVTLNGVSAGSGALAAQWSAVSIYKKGTDEWIVNGAIGDVT